MSGYIVLLLMAVTLIFSAAGTYYVKNEFDKVAQQHAITLQLNADTIACNKDKQITQEAANDYETRISALNIQLASVKRMQPSRCIMPIAAKPASRTHAAAGKSEPAQQHGVSTGWLYGYAGTCEKLRIQVIGLQNFITLTWASRQ